MKWEYRRVLLSVNETVNGHEKATDKKYNKRGQVVNSDATDTVEELFNQMGGDGWELVTAVNLDSGADSGHVPVTDVIEYMFKREK